MKRLSLIAALPLFLILSLSGRSIAQINIATHSLNIYRDTLNLVLANSGSAACGNNNNVNVGSACAFGERNTIGTNASGSFAVGFSNTITSAHAVCLGSNNNLSSSGGFVCGNYLQSSGTNNSFVIGNGLASNAKLSNNNENCLLVGFYSTKPTLTITKSNNNYSQNILDKTGKVAIGDVTPTAKLHIRSDVGEDASLILEPNPSSSNNSFIQLGDNYHKITVSSNGTMNMTAGARTLNLTGGNFSVSGGRMDLGTVTDPKLVLTVLDSPALYCNANPSHGTLLRIVESPSYALNFANNGLLVRTAEFQQYRDEITNWRNALFLGLDGTITLNGKVGVNTDNETDDYSLAVNGGIIATKVHIQDVNDWPDFVFDEDYPLTPLGELGNYLKVHRHLPDIPSSEEMRTNGCDLVETNTVLLRKIEELTLYILSQEERISKLEEQLKGREDRP